MWGRAGDEWHVIFTFQYINWCQIKWKKEISQCRHSSCDTHQHKSSTVVTALLHDQSRPPCWCEHTPVLMFHDCCGDKMYTVSDDTLTHSVRTTAVRFLVGFLRALTLDLSCFVLLYLLPLRLMFFIVLLMTHRSTCPKKKQRELFWFPFLLLDWYHYSGCPWTLKILTKANVVVSNFLFYLCCKTITISIEYIFLDCGRKLENPEAPGLGIKPRTFLLPCHLKWVVY